MPNENDVITVSAKTIKHSSSANQTQNYEQNNPNNNPQNDQEEDQEEDLDQADFQTQTENSTKTDPNLNPSSNPKLNQNIFQSAFQAVWFYLTHPKKAFGDFKDWVVANQKQIRKVLLIIFGIFLLLLTILAFWLLGKYNEIGDVRTIIQPPAEGSIVYDKNGEVLFHYFNPGEQRESVSISQIPEDMQLAMVALEDENFYTNAVGIPWQNLIGASAKCTVSDNCRGGSGLSQQLVKKATGNDDRSLNRKLTELLIAIKLNQELNKQDILELYLNYVPYGRNTYGVQQASKSFFGYPINQKTPEGNYKLTLPQACLIASMPQKPTTYTLGIEDYLSKNLESEKWQNLEARKNICLRKLYERDLKGDGKKRIISEAELKDLQNADLGITAKPEQNLEYGHLRAYLANEIEQKLGITEEALASSRYEIKTTFDKKIQDNTQNIVFSNAENIAKIKGNNSSAVVLEGSTGGITAMVGSIDFNNAQIQGQVNVATSPRQPGSSFKPYVFASAFEKGFNPGTPLVNLVTDFGQYAPQNFARNTPAITSIRYVLANSLNIPSVKGVYLLQNPSISPNSQSGAANLFQTTENLGVKTPLKTANNCGVSSALGTCEVTALSHAGGINALLHDGILNEPNPFLSVTQIQRNIFSDKQVNRDIYAEKMNSSQPPYVKNRQAIDVLAARQVTNIMADYGARDPNVWGNARFGLELAGWTGVNSVAAKTGTTSDVKDTWTVGGSPLYTVVTWVGNTDNKPMADNITAVNGAMPIWNKIMVDLHTGKTPVGFNYQGLQSVRLDSTTGFLSESGNVNELLTPNQIQILNQAKQRLSAANYDPYASSIFENRSEIVPLKLKINVADGKKIPANSSIPDNFTKEIECRAIISAFPQNPAWAYPAKVLTDQLKDKPEFAICPTEFTTATAESLLPQITVNVDEAAAAPETLLITAKSANPTGKIISLSLNIDGKTVVEINNKDNIEFDWMTENISGIYDIIITAKDEFGKENTRTIKKVDFDPKTYTPTPLTAADISKLVVTCDPVSANTPTDCQITIPKLKTIPSGFKVYIGTNIVGSTCTSSGLCSAVPTLGNLAGKTDIKASITGSVSGVTQTASSVVLS